MGTSKACAAKRLAVFAVLYLSSVLLGYQFYLTPQSLSAFWGASGVLLGALLLCPASRWPIVLVLALGLDMIAARIEGNEGTIGFADLTAVIEATLGASLLRLLHRKIEPSSVKPLVALIVLGAFLAPAIASLWGARNFLSYQPDVKYWAAWQVWWLADLLGVLVAAPLVLAWGGEIPIRRRKEGIAALVVLGLAVILVLGGSAQPFRNILDFPYIVAPILAWIALRLSIRFVTLATVILALGTVGLAVADRGPFVLTVGANIQANVLAIQAFLISMVVSTLLLHAAVADRRRANTERLRVIQAARQWQQLELLGRLSADVAHSFNNDLMVIRGFADVAKGRSDDDEVDDALQEIEAAAERSAEVIKQLQSFSGERRLQATAVDVDELLEDMSDVIRKAVGPRVDVEVRPAAGERIEVDRSGFEQCLLNIAINARDAMHGGGHFHVDTRVAERDAAPIGSGAEASLRFVQVSVTDDGAGMEPHVLEKAFEPFFTTKPEGTGTGLGLASVDGFMKQSGGWVEIDTSPGKGTQVRLLFPVA